MFEPAFANARQKRPLLHGSTSHVTANNNLGVTTACGAEGVYPAGQGLSLRYPGGLDLGKSRGPMVHDFDLTGEFAKEAEQ